jgi:hypothetical protein
MRLEPDVRLGDRYVLEERIAVGGMGEVWRGRDAVLGRLVAVKVLREGLGADPEFRRRFHDEARHTAALSHPGIAGVFDYGESADDTPYLVMELVDGEPLSALLAREGPRSPERTLDIVAQAALALQAAHDAGVVHRDVKPGNLLVRPDGVVKVTDFGIARAVDAAPITATGLVVGTAQYLSPEQAAGKPATPASDVYSLGVVAYECLTGRPPFTGDGPVAVALAHLNQPSPKLPGSVPIPVRDLVDRALEKQPSRRPGSAGDFGRTALALRVAMTDGEPLPAPPVVPPAAAGRPAGATVETRVVTGLVPTPDDTDRPDAPGAATTVSERAVPAPLPLQPADPRQRRVRNIMILAALAIVVVGGLLLHSCGGPSSALVPPVKGMAVADATARLRALDFTVTSNIVHDTTHRKGTVLGQDPAAGKRLTSGSRVTLTVASGARQVTVNGSAYVGRPYDLVRAALTRLGLSVQRVDRSSAATADTVLSVAPTGAVTEGSTVAVVVATPQPVAPAKGDKGKGKHGGGDG